ncbi:TIM-barrel domain-containing protein [Planctomycetota bacterium]
MKFTFLFIGTVMSLLGSASAAGLDDLKPINDWEEVAAGVWRASVGDMTQETRYTDLAARPPRLKALLDLPRVTFPFAAGDIRVLQTERQEIMVRIPTAADEKLYGFGLQFDGLRKSGQVLHLNVDHWAKGGGRTHAPVPFYLSSRGYGVFFNTARFLKVHAQIGNRKDSPNNPAPVDRNPMPDEKQPGRWQAKPASDAVEARIQGQGLEVLVFSGTTLLEIVQRYNLYSGGGALPPLWGLGFWHRVPAKFNANQTQAEIDAFKKHRIPLDVIGLEPGWMTKSYPCTFEWNKRRFPDPATFTQDLLRQGIRLNLWENPYISPEARLYEEMFPLSGSHLVWLGLVPDYTLPAARKLLTEQHGRDHIAMGVSGYKIDEVDGYDHWLWPDHATFPSGTSGETMRQTYGLLMQRMLYQDLFQKRNVRTYGLVRASNGAASGYPFAIYSDSYSHSEYITGLSAASLCGILWAPETRSAGNAREWLNRIQTSCFSPLAMLNAWASAKKPWSFPEVTEAVRASVELRLRLLPYIYTAFANYYLKGIPPIRAMILESDHPGTGQVTVVQGVLDGETNPYAQVRIMERNDQFIFGPSIMVAPFYESQATQRQVILPAGNWYDFYTGKKVGNRTRITVTSKQTQNRIPLFVKQGAVIPLLSQTISNTEQAHGSDLELRLYGHAEGRCEIYEDDGKSFDYMNGHYTRRTIEVHQRSSGDYSYTEKRSPEEGPSLFSRIVTLQVMGRE